jgi:8-oxo-dGTP pyrophosphatase MutT (NUDIX family)
VSEAAAAWLRQLRERAKQPPLTPRQTLCWGDAAIGSVEPALPQVLELPQQLQACQHAGAPAWRVTGDDLSDSLGLIARRLRAVGILRAWRNEELAVRDDQGTVLGTIERGAVRPLGIPTQAVHLTGFSPDRRHWVQQRAFDKPNDPGLWDTLVGGAVPASDTFESALERETWEEAGLRPAQLQGLRRGGRVTISRPSAEIPMGYVIEELDWYHCVVPDGVVPVNQDGEVAQFALLDAAEVRARMQHGEFTIDAALILAETGLWWS